MGRHPVLYARLGSCARVCQADANTRKARAMTFELTENEFEIVIEALLKAANRHDSQACVTKGAFRFEHDYKAVNMRKLRASLIKAKLERREQ